MMRRTREMPMSEIVSLSALRKARARAEKERQAAENRTKFGRTKAQKQREAAELARATTQVDAHKRED
jgi:hypothetical protein